MTTYIYKGSTKENHNEIVSIGVAFGLQHIRRMTMGEKIAEMANAGQKKAIKVCEENPVFFRIETK